jgi:hypothetical protein
VEVVHLGAADSQHEPLHQALVEAAHDLGVGLGQLPERAVGEGHRGRPLTQLGVDGDGRVEPQLVQPGHQTGQAGDVARCDRHLGVGLALVAAGLDRLVAAQATGGGHPQQHAGQHRERRRLQAQRGRVGGQRVAVLGTADRAPGVGLDVEQADVAHALEVGPDGVGVQVERLGDLGGGQRARRARQLQVDGVAGVVAQRLEHGEAGGAEAGEVGLRHTGSVPLRPGFTGPDR